MTSIAVVKVTVVVMVVVVLQGPTGTLRVHGYLRGKPISVNGLVHIPGWGEFQLSRISIYQADPYPLDCRNKEDNMTDGEIKLLAEADPDTQETLISTNEVNQPVFLVSMNV